IGAGPGSMIANGMLTIYKESSLSNAVLTNNSWGPTGSPQGYDIPTQQIDMVIRDANPDIVGNQQVQNVWSIMNGGGDGNGACSPSSLGSPDEAKNLFAVGSTGMQTGGGAQVAQIFSVSSNSAHGNACDGRRVPNIVAPGCSTDSATGGSNTAFGFLCGTSMASPVVTGAAAVFVEKFRDENDGATPSPAMIKAALTAVAKDLQGFNDAEGRVMGHRPDRFQGYGRLDLDAVVNSADEVVQVDQTVVLATTGNSWTHTVTAADPTRPVRIMLAWTDAKGHGLGGSSPAWVNNLDLAVSSDAVSYRGNVIGSDGWSASGGSADAINNLEGIFLSPAQIDGLIEISVLAANIAADALNPYVPGSPQQDFALVCYNCADAPLGSADLALSLGGAPAEVGPGGALHFLATVVNFGADAASDVSVTLDLPSELTFVSGRVVTGAGDWVCDSSTGRVVICTLIGPPLPALSLANVLDIETRVSTDAVPGAVLSTTATVNAPQITDGNTDNNSAGVLTPITDVLFADGFE
ncbi:MAG: S8 family serine peptidase, partial [Dokdonella sp.]